MPVVSEAITHYRELVARLEPGWWQAHVAEVEQHWHREAPMAAYVLRPLFVDEATYADTQRSLALVMRGFALATDRLATDAALRRALGIPAYIEPLLEIDRAHGRPTTLGRLDGIRTADGTLALIEHNSEPQSAPFQYELERSFAQLPIARAFAERYHVRSVDLYARMAAALVARAGKQPCIAVLDRALARSPRRAAVFRPLAYAAARGATLLHVDPEELEYKDGKVAAHGIPIDIVAFPSWDLVINARKRIAKLLKAIADGAVDVFAGLSRGLLASYKVIFELLSSPAYRAMFPAEVAAALDRHVPWTRRLREATTDHAGAEVDLLPFVAANRDRLVIKPAGGGGGGNITIGRDATDEAWSAAIQRGVSQGWIVQALAVPERQWFPVASAGEVGDHDLACEYTPYVWNGAQIDGVLRRVVEGSVISDLGGAIGIANGVETATWIIQRR